MKTRPFMQACTVAALVALAPGVLAQGWPDKPVRVIVPFLAGGSIDLVMRLLNEKLGARLGRPVIVENKAGAGGMVGAGDVAKSAPDGHTLLFSAQGPLAIAPLLVKQAPYDPRSAFAPVSLVAVMPNVLLVHPGLPARNPAEFIAHAKANPGKLTYGSQGIGTTGHLSGAMVNQLAGVELVHVPYKGFPPLLTDVKTGRVDMMFVDTINALPRVRAKELVPLAVSSGRRSFALADVPTFAESGYPGVISEAWFAMYAPAGTPADIRRRLADDIREVLKDATVSERLKDLGVEIRGTTPEEHGDATRGEQDRWAQVVRGAGLKPE